MDELAAYERRFRSAGLPLFIEDYSAREDVFTRAAPLLTLVFLGEMLGAVQLAPDGLSLAKPATLTLELPARPAAVSGFAWFGAGSLAQVRAEIIAWRGARLNELGPIETPAPRAKLPGSQPSGRRTT